MGICVVSPDDSVATPGCPITGVVRIQNEYCADPLFREPEGDRRPIHARTDDHDVCRTVHLSSNQRGQIAIDRELRAPDRPVAAPNVVLGTTRTAEPVQDVRSMLEKPGRCTPPAIADTRDNPMHPGGMLSISTTVAQHHNCRQLATVALN